MLYVQRGRNPTRSGSLNERALWGRIQVECPSPSSSRSLSTGSPLRSTHWHERQSPPTAEVFEHMIDAVPHGRSTPAYMGSGYSQYVDAATDSGPPLWLGLASLMGLNVSSSAAMKAVVYVRVYYPYQVTRSYHLSDRAGLLDVLLGEQWMSKGSNWLSLLAPTSCHSHRNPPKVRRRLVEEACSTPESRLRDALNSVEVLNSDTDGIWS
ncbi:hypothetical protein C8Q74DRAFT_1218716 [Fomes fomentarius]|nr:hypothetical protein C8Q74DRAFT_1218716 [Fomes fomentarius]